MLPQLELTVSEPVVDVQPDEASVVPQHSLQQERPVTVRPQVPHVVRPLGKIIQ